MIQMNQGGMLKGFVEEATTISADPFSGRACENKFKVNLSAFWGSQRARSWGQGFHIQTPWALWAPKTAGKQRNHENGSFSAPMERQKRWISELQISRRAEAIGRVPRPRKEAPDPKFGVGGMAKPFNSKAKGFKSEAKARRGKAHVG